MGFSFASKTLGPQKFQTQFCKQNIRFMKLLDLVLQVKQQVQGTLGSNFVSKTIGPHNFQIQFCKQNYQHVHKTFKSNEIHETSFTCEAIVERHIHGKKGERKNVLHTNSFGFHMAKPLFKGILALIRCFGVVKYNDCQCFRHFLGVSKAPQQPEVG